MNMTDRIIAFESGELDDEQIINLFQDLIDTHTIGHLQGIYQRAAVRLLEAGLVTI